MTVNDPLAQLLRDADASHPTPASSQADIAANVRRRCVRRRKRRVAVASALTVAAAIAVGIAELSISPGTATPTVVVAPPRQSPIAPVPANIVALTPETAARLHEMTANRLLARAVPRNAQRDAERVLANIPSPREQRDRAALILLYDADQQLRASRRDDALATYRRAIALFPQSHWADVARQRLKQMQT